jgi:hypothetical protein
MEIQSFILCKEINPSGTGDMLDGRWLGIWNFFPVKEKYPVHGNIPFYILLRRDHRAYDEQCSLRFDLVDADGKPVGQPNGVKVSGVFPAGARFFHLSGYIPLLIPPATTA